VHTIRHIREHSARENKEVVDISLDVGFPIGAKLGSLEQAEVESDVRMVITPFDIQQAGYNSDTVYNLLDAFCFYWRQTKYKLHNSI
jgi:hypothetical protein